MRIVIDMQAVQTESRFCRIGRWTTSLTQAIVRNRSEHEVLLVLSGLFPDTIEPIRAAFDGLLPQENIRVWHAPGPVMEERSPNDGQREVAELIHEAFLASLHPDVIHISSLFEGYADNGVTSIGRFDHNTPVSVSIFDDVALLNPEYDLNLKPHYAQFFYRKVNQLKKAKVILAPSEIAARELKRQLALAEVSVVELALTTDSGYYNSAKQLESQRSEFNVNLSATNTCDTYSWDQSAIIALAVFEALARQKSLSTSSLTVSGRPRLAFVSPLPPARTGIADYSAELLTALAAYYDIEVVVALDQVDQVNDFLCNPHINVRDIDWLRANAGKMDRVLYQIGNSPFHGHMLSLLKEVPGVVVLHDFFLGHLTAWLEIADAPHYLDNSLYSSHGYIALRNRYRDLNAAMFEYPANFEVFSQAHGVIVHSEYARNLARQWYGNGINDDLEMIPLFRSPALERPQGVRELLGLGENDFIVCSFGLLGPTKLNHRLLDAWMNSALAADKRCHLIFVGENHNCEYGASLSKIISKSRLGDRIRITGFASPEMFHHYLMATDVAVQLRTLSRGETSAAALDCMNYALPLIVNANGSMVELDPAAVWMLPDEFEDAALVDALETLWRAPDKRRALGVRAREIVLRRHSLVECAKRYVIAIEHFYRRAETATVATLIHAIADQRDFTPTDTELIGLSKCIAVTFPLPRPAKCLFLDLTATCRNDLKTGIERVARALLLALLNNPPIGYRIEPVYLSDVGGEWHYRYAHRYTLGLLNCPLDALNDERAEPECGDVLLGLDFSGDMLVEAERSGLLANYRNRGVVTYFLIYDLLPIRIPDVFPPGADKSFAKWLRAISALEGVICISKAVADDLAAWQVEADVEWGDRRPFKIGWSHLGADIVNSSPSRGLPDNAEWVLRQVRSRPTFLMVGTIEPRKGYFQTIEEFSQIWNEGIDINLVIVGNEGWKNLPNDMRRDIPMTVACLRSHPKLNKRLFWLKGISDEYLEQIYAASACLIAASFGEGFGLPLIEAAQHKLPIIARDIPVFREVAGSHAYYFDSTRTGAIRETVVQWLRQSPNESAHTTMSYQTWEDCAINLTKLIIKEMYEKGFDNSLHSGMSRGNCHVAKQRLYVDVSVVYKNDFRTGIQRVVRSVLLELIANPPEGYRVVPVYLDKNNNRWGYHVAHQMLREYQKLAAETVIPVSMVEFLPANGDILLGLDLAGGYVVAASSQGLYKHLMQAGMNVYFVVYDLLPITQGEFFCSNDAEGHRRWLESISKCSGVICISKTVENEYIEWHRSYFGRLPDKLTTSHFQLGSDMERSSPTYGLPEDAEKILAVIRGKVSFLIVGTVEPRKGHLQVINSFELLWQNDVNANLVFVGKQGWMVESLVARIFSHPELNKRLFWLAGISDEYLEKIYDASTCLIAASYGEGFGLPIIEAAQHKLPIIARDIPVFREVADEHAYYFKGNEPQALAETVKAWLVLHKQGKAPSTQGFLLLTWFQSSRQLLKQIIR